MIGYILRYMLIYYQRINRVVRYIWRKYILPKVIAKRNVVERAITGDKSLKVDIFFREEVLCFSDSEVSF